ncbi:hypothetical protein AB0G15_11745 [Streptosporangium sp. NPDC023825]|uniref:hypothetical protein n=1 Tax=Streptosporangium sp. NPDC023825 TaxID=3154909 RepID=UPI0034356323
MNSVNTKVRKWGRRTAVLLTAVFALGAAIAPSTSAATVLPPPHPPIGSSLSSSSLTSPQFCSDGKPLSRSLTPFLRTNKGIPAYNSDRPDLQATFEVAPVGRSPLVRVTVPFYGSLATYQVPENILTEGEYRFRARTVDDDGVSTWMPWCTFTVATVNVPKPGVPAELRISASLYSGSQFCGNPVISTVNKPTFGATATPFSYPHNPNLIGRFEIGRPGEEPLVVVGKIYAVSTPPGAFATAGTYHFRVRAEEGDAVSEWSPWCEFTVEQSSR